MLNDSNGCHLSLIGLIVTVQNISILWSVHYTASLNISNTLDVSVTYNFTLCHGFLDQCNKINKAQDSQ